MYRVLDLLILLVLLMDYAFKEKPLNVLIQVINNKHLCHMLYNYIECTVMWQKYFTFKLCGQSLMMFENEKL